MVESDAGVLIWKVCGGLASASVIGGTWLRAGIRDLRTRLEKEAELGEARSAKNAEAMRQGDDVIHARINDQERRFNDAVRLMATKDDLAEIRGDLKEHRTESNKRAEALNKSMVDRFEKVMDRLNQIVGNGHNGQ